MMEMEINPIPASPIRENRKSERKAKPLDKKNTKEIPQFTSAPKKAEIEKYMRQLFKSNLSLLKKLKYSVNEELGQVVVKVIDPETDKVIKEIPSEEMQNLHIRIREAIGLLIDEQI